MKKVIIYSYWTDYGRDLYFLWGRSMKRIKTGVVGAASIAGRAFMNPLREAEGGELTGIASRDPERAALMAETYNTEVYEDYSSLAESCEALYIPLNNRAHCRWVKEALKKGCHVLVEKPLCLNSSELEEILSSVPESTVLMEGAMTGFHPWFSWLQEEMENETWGKLLYTETVMNTLFTDEENYRLSEREGGGVFYDMGTYWLDFLQRVFPGDPELFEIHDLIKNEKNIDTQTEILAVFSDKRSSRFSTSFHKNFKAMHTLVFEEAELNVRNFFACAVGTNKLTVKITTEKGTEKKSFEKENYYVNQLNRFYSLIQRGEGNGEDFREYRRRVRLHDRVLSHIKDGV